MTIWKYQLATDVVQQEIDMPMEAEFLSVQLQRGVPCLWVAINPDAERRKLGFEWVPTGAETPELGVYVGTVLMDDGNLVLHLYETGHDGD